MRKVFVSYTHDSPEHADKVLALSDRLIRDGVDCILDQYEDSPAEGWPRWMDTNIKNADFVLMICTETYYKRVMGEDKPGKGRGVRWEGNLIYQHIYNADTRNTKFIPLLFDGSKPEYIPAPLGGATHYWVDSEQGYEDLYRRLTNQPKTIKPKLGKFKNLPPRQRKQDFFAVQVTLSKLPTTGKDLFGREEELAMLDRAWEEPHTNILSLVAWGGVGKTALVNHWLGYIEHDNWRGAERVFGWSFYSQGTREDRQASGDEFLAYSLKWFGDPDPKEGLPWNKGLRLAHLVRQQRTLLILDGLEPLQYPPGPMEGRLKDQGLQALLKELVGSNPGLCVLTTREKVKDIDHAEGSTLKTIFLENLSTEAGVELLKNLAIKGTDKELREAVENFDGHALALNLLGTYLATVHEGEIRKRDLVPRLTDEEEQGGHAKRVMKSYEIWLKGTLELDVLYLMGLFDRPAPGGAIKVLREKPAIKGLADKLQGLSETNWQYAVKHLRDLRLLGQRDENDPDKLDCHPLIREHFGEKLKKENPKGWRQAHGRLYEYYKGVPKKEYPDTLEEMEPLFAAVAHGCQAGRQQETLDDVFKRRMDRGEAFVGHNLGAMGAVLACLAGFFDEPWGRVTAELREQARAYVLNVTGFCLRALGRLTEAAEPMKASLQFDIENKRWKFAATAAGNLSELYLTLGQVKEAVDYARQSVEYADLTNQWGPRRMYRTTLADALYQEGEPGQARGLFDKAEEMQKDNQPEYPYLYSVQAFGFCDLLLSTGQYKEVLKRASQTLEWAKESLGLLDIALDKLSLGRAYLLEAVAEGRGQKPALSAAEGTDDRGLSKRLAKAADFLNQAVDGLREAGQQPDLPLGLLARADLYRYQQRWEKAWADLEEAKEIAERGQMNLYMADYHLEAARLCLAQGGRLEEARQHYEQAAKRVKDMGYHRRDPEVLLIQAEIEFAEGKKAAARKTLKAAERRIEEMGCHRWDIEVKRLQKSFEC